MTKHLDGHPHHGPPKRTWSRADRVASILCIALSCLGLGAVGGAKYILDNPPPRPAIHVAAPATPAPIIAGRIIPDEDWLALRGSIDAMSVTIHRASESFRDAVQAEAVHIESLATKSDVDLIRQGLDSARRNLYLLAHKPPPPAPILNCPKPAAAPVVHHPRRHGTVHRRPICPWAHQHQDWQ
jgi:hypothetical protein